MRFGKKQQAVLARSWNKTSWFYRELGEPARAIVERAYGLRQCDPALRYSCQEDVSLALSIFAVQIQAEKAQCTHAFLTGSIKHLRMAIRKRWDHTGKWTGPSSAELVDPWTDAFRDVAQGRFDINHDTASL